MKRAIIWFAAICAVSCSASARGDDLDRFRAVLAGAEVEQHILDAAKKSTVLLEDPCPSAQFSAVNRVAILKPPAFDRAGAMVGGAWKESVEERGCGTNHLLNVLAVVRQPSSLVSMPLLPGTTHADPLLQKDGVHYAVVAIGGPEKNCSIGYVADTQFIQAEAAPMNGGKSPPWTESWMLVSCTKEYRVSLRFIPDATGTTITAHLDATMPLRPAK